jgi:hypothetical protein
MKLLLRAQMELFASPARPPELISSERQKAIALLRGIWSARNTGDHRGRPQTRHARQSPAQLEGLGGSDPGSSCRLSYVGRVREKPTPDCRQCQWKELYGPWFDKTRRGIVAGTTPVRPLWPTSACSIHW